MRAVCSGGPCGGRGKAAGRPGEGVVRVEVEETCSCARFPIRCLATWRPRYLVPPWYSLAHYLTLPLSSSENDQPLVQREVVLSLS